MPEEKVIKSGQLTLSRVFFLAVCGGIVFLLVASGKLIIGYHLLTLVLCGLLFLIATDWGVNLEPVETARLAGRPDERQAGVSTGSQSTEPMTAQAAARDARVKRKSSRQSKRRR